MVTTGLPTTVRDTTDALHRVAEHVVSPARYLVTGWIGLRPAAGGFATPPFGDDHRVVAVDGVDLVLRIGSGERRTRLTTLRAAGEFIGIEPGAPAHVYRPATSLDLDEPLVIDPHAAHVLADWYALGNEALERLRAAIADEQPSEAQLWPEHFDLGITAGTVNYGVSPGDDHVPEPYLYVGPHDGPPIGDAFWNAPFGAVRTIHDVRSVDDAVAFFRAGHERLADHSPEKGESR
jgi:hypothetical protein